MAQIATFYAGAMTEAREIELGPIAAPRRRPRPRRRRRQRPRGDAAPHRRVPHPRASRSRPTRRQQLAFDATAESIRQLIDGATYLFTNEYESRARPRQKTGWSAEEIADRVHDPGHHPGQGRRRRRRTKGEDADRGGRRPRGAQGRPDRRRRRLPRRLPHRPGRWAWTTRRCAELGSMLATYVIETVGTQEYELGQARFLDPPGRGLRRRVGRRDRAAPAPAPRRLTA